MEYKKKKIIYKYIISLKKVHSLLWSEHKYIIKIQNMEIILFINISVVKLQLIWHFFQHSGNIQFKFLFKY